MTSPLRRHLLRWIAFETAVGVPLVFAVLRTKGAQPPLLRVDGAWVRATVEGQTGSGAYARLTARENLQLVGASCALAEKVEIHEMREVNKLMTMRRIENLALPANTEVALEHERHIMLIGLKEQLIAGKTLAFQLKVRDAAGKRHDIPVVAPIRPLNTVESAPAHHD